MKKIFVLFFSLQVVGGFSPPSKAQELHEKPRSTPRPQPTLRMPNPVKSSKPSSLKKLRLRDKSSEMRIYREAFSLYKGYAKACEIGLQRAAKKRSMRLLQKTIKEPARRFLSYLARHQKQMMKWTHLALTEAQGKPESERLLYTGFAMTLKYFDFRSQGKTPQKALAETLSFMTKQDKNVYQRLSKKQIERMQAPLMVVFNNDIKSIGAR